MATGVPAGWMNKEVTYDLSGFTDCDNDCASNSSNFSVGNNDDAVDGEYFLYWIKNYSCPMLGNYERGEARSVVLVDNASTHMGDEIEAAIAMTDAILIYGAPFSPHLNPIEYYFAC